MLCVPFSQRCQLGTSASWHAMFWYRHWMLNELVFCTMTAQFQVVGSELFVSLDAAQQCHHVTTAVEGNLFRYFIIVINVILFFFNFYTRGSVVLWFEMEKDWSRCGMARDPNRHAKWTSRGKRAKLRYWMVTDIIIIIVFVIIITDIIRVA